MCDGVPLPTEAKENLPGADFAAATISCRVFAGAAGFAAISCGTLTMIDTGTKSRSTS